MNRGLAPIAALVLASSFAASGCSDSDKSAEKTSVVVRVQYPPKRPVFVEGAVTEFRLVSTKGKTVAQKNASTTVPVLLATVTPGRYALNAAVRPCDGNCGHLDPAAFACHGPIDVPQVGDARVIVTVGQRDCDVTQQPNV